MAAAHTLGRGAAAAAGHLPQSMLGKLVMLGMLGVVLILPPVSA